METERVLSSWFWVRVPAAPIIYRLPLIGSPQPVHEIRKIVRDQVRRWIRLFEVGACADPGQDSRGPEAKLNSAGDIRVVAVADHQGLTGGQVQPCHCLLVHASIRLADHKRLLAAGRGEESQNTAGSRQRTS